MKKEAEEKKRIMVVDDDESIRKTFYLILNKNYQIFLAKNTREAFHHFRKAKIDLIIADLKLPDGSGVEMTAKFRDAGYTGEVILISAYPDLIDLEELTRLSIGHFFVKPLDLKALNHSIDVLLCPQEKGEKRL